MRKEELLIDVISIAASATLFFMTFLSIKQAVRVDYQINTGIFCAIMCLLPMILRRFRIITLPLILAVMIEASIFLHGYGVLLLKYDLLAKWDTVTHTISSVTVSMCIFVCLLAAEHESEGTEFSPVMMAATLPIIMLAFGAFWELFELVADGLWDLNMQYSPWDTVRDLLSDLLGASIVSIYAYLFMKRRDTSEFVQSMQLSPKVSELLSRLGSHGPTN